MINKIEFAKHTCTWTFWLWKN